MSPCSRSTVMDRRQFLGLSGLTVTALTFSGCQKTALTRHSRPCRPNLLFIYTDDQAFDAMGAYGGDVKTPNIDQLAQQGVVFTHAYNQGAWHGAVCVASRTMLNTGRFLWNAKAVEQTLDEEKSQGRFWSQYLKQAGYDTYFSGKWHVQTPVEDLFDTVRHVRPGMPKDVPQGYQRPVEGQPDSWTPWDDSWGGYWQGGRHWSEIQSEDGQDFLKQAAQKQNPFFIYLAFNAPHDPRQSPKEFVDQYPPETVALPDNFQPDYPYRDAMGCPANLRDEALAPIPRTEAAVKTHRSEYYAMITHLDVQIGHVLKMLKKQGLEKNTYIFLTSDNGLAIGRHGLFGKQNMFEHSMKVPLIVAGPGIHPDRIDLPVYLQDIMPTCLELAGVQKPAHLQFNSLLPLIQHKTQTSYNAIYGGYMDTQRMAIDGQYKLILYPTIQKVLLFDLHADPGEKTDLSERPDMQPVIKTLFRKFLALQKQTGDTLDVASIYPATQ